MSVISDVKLPGISWVSILIPKIKEINNKIEIVVLTVHTEQFLDG